MAPITSSGATAKRSAAVLGAVNMHRLVKHSSVISLAVLIGTLFGGCAAATKRSGDAGRSRVVRAIQAVLDDQNDAWNRGDIDAFMEGYWNSPELTFVSGGNVTKGWQPTLDGYKKRYPDRATMGTLTFSDLNIRELARDAALVSGRWHLRRGEPIGGRFTLLFRRKAGKWLIVYDHTSVARDRPSG